MQQQFSISSISANTQNTRISMRTAVMGSYGPFAPQTALEDAHEVTQSHDGRQEVKYPFAFKNLDWESYHRYRPRYPDSMLKTWLSYHRRYGGEFHCAHDLGAGPGTLATRLSPHFTRLIISDAGAANICCARENLASPTARNSRCLFIQSPAEHVYAFLPAASVDFISVGMAFHYFQAPDAIRSIARMLKPGGTLAACTYGFRLHFPGRPQLDRLWYAIASQESLRLIREGRLFPAAVQGLANAMAGLDFVPLQTEWFEEGATRVTVNASVSQRPLAFVDEDPCWEPSASQVGREDVQMMMRDREWRMEAGVEWLQGFLASCQMGFGECTWAMPEWQVLEELVCASEGGKVTVEWPVAIIMATRNTRPVNG